MKAYPRPQGDRIMHRVAEAQTIERMPFFKEDQRNYTPEDRKLKDRWLKIIDERIAKLPKSQKDGVWGRPQLNARAARGIETTTGGSANSIKGTRYPEYMKEADERNMKND